MKDPRMATAAVPKDLAQPVFSHILVSTDFSHRSQAAVSYALQLAMQAHAQLTLLHVLPELSALNYTLGGFPETGQDRAKEEASSLLDEAVAHAKRTFLEIDSLTPGCEPDLIFGTKYQTPLKRFQRICWCLRRIICWLEKPVVWLRCQKILEHAPCPILILRF